MKVNESFVVAAPLARTWDTLLDMERVAGCLPGVTVIAVDSGGVRARMKVRLGAIASEYDGTAALREVDEDEHVAVVAVQGRELRGNGTASAVIANTLTAEGTGTRVDVEVDLHLTGKQAQFGRGLIGDVAKALLADFARRLEQAIKTPAGEDPSELSESTPEVLDLGRAAWRPLLRRGLPFLAGVAGAIVGFLAGRGSRRP